MDIAPLLIWGPVKNKSGTSDLIREAKRYSVRGMKIIFDQIKHIIDARSHDTDGLVTSRDGTALHVAHVTDWLSYEHCWRPRRAYCDCH